MKKESEGKKANVPATEEYSFLRDFLAPLLILIGFIAAAIFKSVEGYNLFVVTHGCTYATLHAVFSFVWCGVAPVAFFLAMGMKPRLK